MNDRSCAPAPVRAVLFDMDGTLIDTEVHTDTVIAAVAARHGVHGFALPPAQTRGVTWIDVAEAMRTQAGLRAICFGCEAEALLEGAVEVRAA